MGRSYYVWHKEVWNVDILKAGELLGIDISSLIWLVKYWVNTTVIARSSALSPRSDDFSVGRLQYHIRAESTGLDNCGLKPNNNSEKCENHHLQKMGPFITPATTAPDLSSTSFDVPVCRWGVLFPWIMVKCCTLWMLITHANEHTRAEEEGDDRKVQGEKWRGRSIHKVSHEVGSYQYKQAM